LATLWFDARTRSLCLRQEGTTYDITGRCSARRQVSGRSRGCLLETRQCSRSVRAREAPIPRFITHR